MTYSINSSLMYFTFSSHMLPLLTRWHILSLLNVSIIIFYEVGNFSKLLISLPDSWIHQTKIYIKGQKYFSYQNVFSICCADLLQLPSLGYLHQPSAPMNFTLAITATFPRSASSISHLFTSFSTSIPNF